MSLRQIYTQFLSAPASGVLAGEATINYVPTLTSISEPAAIIKHLSAQAKALTKKKENVIHAVESDSSLTLEVDTTIEFVTGGGAYLPGLDDNFLADSIVQFPVVHVVQFDNLQKISQIRLYWDQGSVLKSIEVIGSRGRNWPLRDGLDQVRLIESSASVKAADNAVSRRSTASQGAGNANASRIATAEPTSIVEEAAPRKNSIGVAPRMSAKPPSRDLADILSGKQNEQVPGTPDGRSASPTKNMEGAPKMGAGKNYHPSRLFDKNNGDEQPSPEKSAIKTHPKKYKHFEFGDGEGAVQGNIRSRAKHESQWDFADFTTPIKPTIKTHPQNARTFGWSDDEEEAPKSPVRREIVHHSRPTNESHFDIADEATPVKEQSRPSSKHQNNNMGLYTDNVTDSDPSARPGKPMPLSTNPNLSNRNKDFGPHFEMADQSPAGHVQERKKDENQEQVIKGMGANWGMYDESPANKKENRGIKLGGNGMGGRKEANANWLFGGDDVTAHPEDKTNAANKPDRGIKLGGNGMGGRRGIGANWAFGGGDEEDGAADESQQRSSRPIAPKTATAGTISNQKSSGWDF